MAQAGRSERHLPALPTWAHMAIDASLLAAAAFVAMRFAPIELFPGSPLQGFPEAWALLHVVLLPIAFLALNQYSFLGGPSFSWSFPRILLPFLALELTLLLFLAMLGLGAAVDRDFVLVNFALGMTLVNAWRGIASERTKRQVRSGKKVANLLLVGEGLALPALAKAVVADPLLGRRLVGFIGLDPGPAPSGQAVWGPGGQVPLRDAIRENSLHGHRHLWASLDVTASEVEMVLDGLGVEEVFLGPRAEADDVEVWLRACQVRGVDVHLVPAHQVRLGLRLSAWTLGEFSLLDVHRRPFSRLGWWAKRGMDIVGSAVGLIVFSPVIAAVALATKLEHPKNQVFYAGRRTGLKGRIFRMAKFTTMVPEAQKLERNLQAQNQREGPWFKLDADDDPRLTKVGRFIRKYSINEIPQFWNVLKGEMSLVGPRPPIPEEVATYLDYDIRYYRCLDVKPGLTGLWQVTAKDDPSFDRRIELDLRYMEEWSIWLDIKIMLLTLGALVRHPEE
ncbi:MAG TPA: exopolysaccharide biosynthesis polyprenyl glycosylphosphotransferase [Candidatus Thermoplasmatota archaeon]|nr:exopolysaccharide biosynthesis polyprenyl glycosylphosphotransferase [Candidatus Thermoplasmatota archaeon]